MKQGGQFSPDSRWVAYVSDETGRYEVYVESLPRGKGRWRISTGGGIQPRWRRDGRELFYYDRIERKRLDVCKGPLYRLRRYPILTPLDSACHLLRRSRC